MRRDRSEEWVDRHRMPLALLAALLGVLLVVQGSTLLGSRSAESGRLQAAAGEDWLLTAEQTVADSRKRLVDLGPRSQEALQMVRQAWQDAEEHFRIFHTAHRGVSPLIRMNLPISITTRNTKWKRLGDMVLLTTFLPSLLKTMEPGYLYGVYLGIDVGDPLLDAAGSREEMMSLWQAICQKHGRSVELKMFTYNDTAHHNVWAVNYITKEAYLDGYDYFFRVNDDSEFKEPGWTSRLVEALQRNEDFGAAGVLDHVNPRIWTHSIVGRLHIEIFGFHFPFSFGNYWSDDWITEAYTRRFSLWLYDVPVRHLTHPERYNINWKDSKKRLQVELERARLRWAKWLCQAKDAAEFCGDKTPLTHHVQATSPAPRLKRGYDRATLMAMENKAKEEQFLRMKNFGGIKKVKLKD